VSLFTAAVFAAAVRAGTPVLFATLGEIFAERAGILNLGVEGMMLVGALAGFATTVRTGNPWLGVLAAGAAGGLLSLIHAVLSITLRSNQIASGLALTIFGTGLSASLGRGFIGVPAPGFQPMALPGLSAIPLLGPVLFQQDPLVYLSYPLVPIAWYIMYRTRWGLNIRAVGEHPEAADAMGVDVARVRYACVATGGVLAGLGGTFLSTAYTSMWVENMTAGRGWIAVALVIFATWDRSAPWSARTSSGASTPCSCTFRPPAPGFRSTFSSWPPTCSRSWSSCSRPRRRPANASARRPP